MKQILISLIILLTFNAYVFSDEGRERVTNRILKLSEKITRKVESKDISEVSIRDLKKAKRFLRRSLNLINGEGDWSRGNGRNPSDCVSEECQTFSQMKTLILDEYQESFTDEMEKFEEYFFAKDSLGDDRKYLNGQRVCYKWTDGDVWGYYSNGKKAYHKWSDGEVWWYYPNGIRAYRKWPDGDIWWYYPNGKRAN